MSCSCDFDQPKVARKVRRKTRKERRCTECCRRIMVGETYEVHTCLHEDNWGTWCWCLHCAEARPTAGDIADCHCWLYEFVWEDLREHAQDERNMRLIRLVKGADRKWTYQRGPRKGQLVPVPK